MLTLEDIEFIKETRKEIIQHRLKSFMLVGSTVGPEDPFTGNATEVPYEFEAFGTWTPMTGSGTSGTDYDYIDGVKVMTGDIIANVGIEYNIEGATHAVRDGITYVIRAIERLGLGEDNRYFILMRRVY